LLLLFQILCGLHVAWSIEQDDVYRYRGNYRVFAGPSLKLYYPDRVQEAVPRIHAALLCVRERMIGLFPQLQNFQVKVILTDHDDRDSGSADSIFDLISLGVFEETDSLSTRGYSIEQRLAYRLAYILILRSFGSAKIAIKRRIAMLSIPPWFLEGLAMHYAFPMEPLHAGRLLEMARTGRLFDLDEMDKMTEQEWYVREQILFQARSMIDFWETKVGDDAGNRFISLMNRRPGGFAETFQKVYGCTIGQGFADYHAHVAEMCRQRHCEEVQEPIAVPGIPAARFIQSWRSVADGRQFWVSSRRYTEEVYDLYSRAGSGTPRLLWKNVHPSFLLSPTGDVFLAAFSLNRQREKRLNLWHLAADGHRRKLSTLDGSFKPLTIMNDRLWFVNVRAGTWSLRSVALDPGKDTGERLPEKTRGENQRIKNRAGSFRKVDEREELILPLEFHLLDVEMDGKTGDVFLIIREGEQTSLVRFSPGQHKTGFERLYRCNGTLRGIRIAGDSILFGAETGIGSNDTWKTIQLFRLSFPGGVGTLERLTAVPGGIWDFSPASDGNIMAITVGKDGFVPVTIVPEVKTTETIETSCELVHELPPDIPGKEYRTEYKSSYWLPKLSRDDQGGVWGVYSYRADTLDRSRVVFSPTFGLKSRNWGYTADITRRFDLWKVGLGFSDEVRRKSYRSNSYYERDRTTRLELHYPLSLATVVRFGGDLTKRAIAEFPEKGGFVPSVGHDNSIFATISHRGIRTEPYWDILPRKGRRYTLSYRKGLDWLGGDLVYDSRSVRWEEFIPWRNRLVWTLRGWVADDDKEGDIRRPEDLALGGSDFLRGFPGSVRFGDSLRVFSVHLARPFHFALPFLRKWVQKEILVVEAFWERGDVRSEGRAFDFLEDAGFEVRAKGLVLRRLPVVLRFGTAWPRGGGESHSYWGVDFSSLSGLVK
jgi:hypothetical protein